MADSRQGSSSAGTSQELEAARAKIKLLEKALAAARTLSSGGGMPQIALQDRVRVLEQECETLRAAVRTAQTGGARERRQSARNEADRRATAATQLLADAERRASEAERRASDAERRASDAERRLADAERVAAEAGARAEAADRRWREAEVQKAAVDPAELEHARAKLDALQRQLEELRAAWRAAEERGRELEVTRSRLAKLDAALGDIRAVLAQATESSKALVGALARIVELESRGGRS